MVYVMRNGRRVIAALSFLLLCCGVHVHAQRVAVKTNGDCCEPNQYRQL